jgi:hypothetical protein
MSGVWRQAMKERLPGSGSVFSPVIGLYHKVVSPGPEHGHDKTSRAGTQPSLPGLEHGALVHFGRSHNRHPSLKTVAPMKYSETLWLAVWRPLARA